MKFTLKPVVGEKFIGRKKEISALVGELGDRESCNGFCIYGRRRVGKTSLLKEAVRRLSRDKHIVVSYLSLFELPEFSEESFASLLSEAVIEAFREKGILPLEYSMGALMGAPLEIVEKALSGAKLGAELSGELRVFVELRRKKPGDYGPYIKRAFSLGERLASAKGAKFVLIIDEFPELLKMPNGLQLVKMMRTESEGHSRTALVLSGSIQNTVEAVALSEASPFYKQLIPMKLEPFSVPEVAEFLREYDVRAGKGDAEILARLTGGLPFYLQYMGRSMELGRIEAGVEEFVEQEGNVFFAEEMRKLSERERALVISMGRGNTGASEIAKAAGHPASSASIYFSRLEDKGVISREGRGEYRLCDPVFALWLRKKYGP